MSGKVLSPIVVSEAIALREAGFTVLAISQKLAVPVRTLHRHFAHHGVAKGTVKAEILEQARADLLACVRSDDTIRNEAAKLIQDDLAHARHLRQILVSATEHLQATSLAEAVLVMRAAAAYSTAAKNTSDMVRHTLGLDREHTDDLTDLPELVVREIGDAEAAQLHAGDRLSEWQADGTPLAGSGALETGPSYEALQEKLAG